MKMSHRASTRSGISWSAAGEVRERLFVGWSAEQRGAQAAEANYEPGAYQEHPRRAGASASTKGEGKRL